jgi:hypothetical protein
LDSFPPSPDADLLSAEDAGARLREIVEGFFFRRLRTEDGKRVGRLLLKSPPGLGKTTQAVEFAIRYQSERVGKDGTHLLVDDFNEAGVPAQTSIFVPRHQLAPELRDVIEEAFRERGEVVRVPILRSRENGSEDGNAPCRRWREVRAPAFCIELASAVGTRTRCIARFGSDPRPTLGLITALRNDADSIGRLSQ